MKLESARTVPATKNTITGEIVLTGFCGRLDGEEGPEPNQD
jgi:hypothetical protein